MPDYIDPVHVAEGQDDWPAMLHDLEKRVELLSDALEGVKLSMRRLVLAEPRLKQAETTHQGGEKPSQPGYTAPVQLHPPAAFQAPEPVAEVTPLHPVEYDHDAREAVRRAVEASRPQMAPGSWREETSDFVTEDRPEVSWVTIPDEGAAPEPLPASNEGPADDEDAREAVRRAVEQAKAELSSPAAADAAAPDNAKSGMGFGWGSVAPGTTPAHQEEDAREAVRRAVEEAKAELGNQPASVEPAAAPEEDPEAAREAARLAVEQAKAAMGFGTASNAPSVTPVEDEEAAREAVRQAVLQARAEMATNGGLTPEAPKPHEVAPAYVVPPPHRPERVHPPTITIEDPEGRVELARVYNLLKHLDVAANSSLLNYSARQVSVQLSDSRTAPDGGQVGDAVREVFERDNDVSIDGLNVIVKLGNDYIRAA